MKNSALIFSLLAICIGFSVQAEDEYQYRATPVADQIADLQDDDSDGVINARDKCPETIFGSEIDNDGCGRRIKAEEELQIKILFANDSSSISPAFVSEIESMVEFLLNYPKTSIELQGYASKVGNSDYNMALSKKRAEEVRNKLIDTGISPDRVKIVGFGDSVLVDDGGSELSHALNRRVVATVVGFDDKILKEWNIFSRKKR